MATDLANPRFPGHEASGTPKRAALLRRLSVLFALAGGGPGIGQCLIDQLEQLGAIDNFNKRSALAVRGDHPDGGSVFDADALTQRVIGLHFARKLALGVDRSEERRVGKECRSRWSPDNLN